MQASRAAIHLDNSYSELPNKRPFSLNIFEKKIHPTRNFSCDKRKIPPCLFIDLLIQYINKQGEMRLLWLARLLESSKYDTSSLHQYFVLIFDHGQIITIGLKNFLQSHLKSYNPWISQIFQCHRKCVFKLLYKNSKFKCNLVTSLAPRSKLIGNFSSQN